MALTLGSLSFRVECPADLFILNYHLPQISGIELYDQLHTIKELKHVPAIMVAAAFPEQEVKQRKIVGLKKPSDMNELLDAISKALDWLAYSDLLRSSSLPGCYSVRGY